MVQSSVTYKHQHVTTAAAVDVSVRTWQSLLFNNIRLADGLAEETATYSGLAVRKVLWLIYERARVRSCKTKN